MCNYWYDEYIDYVREKQIFTDFKAKDAFTRKYAKELFSYCGVNFTEELYSYDTFSNEQFSQLIYELKDFFSSGDNLSWVEAAVGAAIGILFAPEKGEDTRHKIAEILRKKGIRLNRNEMENLVDEIAAELKGEANE